VAATINTNNPGDTSVSKKRSGSWSWASATRQAVFYVALLVLWYWYDHSGFVVSYAFADPIDVGHTLVDGFRSGTFEIAILITLRRLVIGYVISLIVGVLLGLLIGRNRYAKETLGSLILGLQALPSVCWIPFALLWFGLSESAMIFVVVMGALFSITLGVEAGVKTTPPLYLKAARNMGARGVALITQVILPGGAPLDFVRAQAGLDLCLALSDGGGIDLYHGSKPRRATGHGTRTIGLCTVDCGDDNHYCDWGSDGADPLWTV
jgi:ABC-type nitrate/sulfonate/bicarbonate transport system permease component